MASIRVLELSPVEGQIEELSYDVAGNIIGGTLLGETIAELVRAVFIQCQITYPDNPEQAVDCTIDILTAIFYGV